MCRGFSYMTKDEFFRACRERALAGWTFPAATTALSAPSFKRLLEVGANWPPRDRLLVTGLKLSGSDLLWVTSGRQLAARRSTRGPELAGSVK